MHCTTPDSFPMAREIEELFMELGFVFVLRRVRVLLGAWVSVSQSVWLFASWADLRQGMQARDSQKPVTGIRSMALVVGIEAVFHSANVIENTSIYLRRHVWRAVIVQCK